MRVISGKARGRKLKSVPGDTTRPIMDRVKEALFNILREFVPNSRWLDLFAGTGQVGIEALSRGAAEVVFVDLVKPAIRVIYENLQSTQLTEGATVVQSDAFLYLQKIRRGGVPKFDCIFVAPPQYKEIWKEVLFKLDEEPEAYLEEDGVIVVQIDPKEYSPLDLKRLVLDDERRYGKTVILFYEIKEPEVEDE